jgi:hypothetical protein
MGSMVRIDKRASTADYTSIGKQWSRKGSKWKREVWRGQNLKVAEASL